jgi:predicted aconitase with swiveling domain
MGLTFQGKAVVKGTARGLALVSAEPLSFWGGYDYHTGEVTDRRHPLSGSIAAGRVLALPFTRGSSTTTAILLEAVHLGTAPAAILTTGVDAFFALASIVAAKMYASPVPIVALTPEDFARLRSGDEVEVGEDGVIRLQRT